MCFMTCVVMIFKQLSQLQISNIIQGTGEHDLHFATKLQVNEKEQVDHRSLVRSLTNGFVEIKFKTEAEEIKRYKRLVMVSSWDMLYGVLRKGEGLILARGTQTTSFSADDCKPIQSEDVCRQCCMTLHLSCRITYCVSTAGGCVSVSQCICNDSLLE